MTRRLLFVDQYGEMGGGQRVLLSILRAAVTTDSTVAVLAPAGGALQAAIADAFGSRVTFVPCEEPRLAHGRKGLRDFLALAAYGWRFRRHRPLLAAQDVIYVNGLRHLPHLLLLARGLRARLIWHVHLDHSGLEKRLLRLAARMRNCWRIVVNSRFVQDRLGVDPHKTVLIENALDADFQDLPFADRFEDCAGWSACVLGTLRPEKGQDVAVQAVAQRPDMALHIIGRDGDGASTWIENVKRAATTNVHFRGAVSNTGHAIAELGIQFNLVPSRWEEPFGLVAIEGMACSCLTIVSGRGGLAEIAEHTGALVAPDAAALSTLLDELCQRPKQDLAAIARSQYDRTVSHYRPARFAGQMAALLCAAAAEKQV